MKFVGINGDNVVPVVDSAYVSSDALISDDGLSITGIFALLSAPGDGTAYDVYIENQGEYDAVIKRIGSKTISGDTVTKRCSGLDVSPSLLNNFCNNIKYGISLYSLDGEKVSEGGVSGVVIKKGEKLRARIVIKYNSDGWYADGPVNVEFGDAYIEFEVYTGE